MSAFGFAGINAHAVLEEHAASADGITPGAILEWDTEAFLLAADDRIGLADLVGWLRDRLNGGTRHSLKDLAFTLNTGSPAPAGRARLGIVAASHDELAAHLAAIEPRLREPSCRQVRDARGLYYWEQPLGGEGTLAFLFPGEGSQYPGMLADLCPHFPELRAVLDTADRIARESGEEVPPSHHLFGSSGSIPEALWATDTAVTAVLSSQWAIFQVLTRLGLRPDAVAGHSSGELPALAAAGVLRTEHTLERQLIRLAAIFRELEAKDAIPFARLVAAGTDRERAEAACRAAGQSVVVAIDNCPHQVVVADLPPRSTASSPTSERRAWSAKNSRLPVRTTRRPSRPFSSRSPLSTGAWSCMPPRCPSTRARRPAAWPNLPTRSAGSPSRSGPGGSTFATRSRPCTGTDCGSSSTWGAGQPVRLCRGHPPRAARIRRGR